MNFERYMPPRVESPAPERIVCAGCRERLVHKLTTLHAGPETVMVYGGAWEGLPQWLRDAFTNAKGHGLGKRLDAVREIREHLEG